MELKEKIEEGIYVCPMPIPWNTFWHWLNDNTQHNEIPLPLVMSAWWYANDYSKNLRLKEQLDIADKYGLIEEAYQFLNKLEDSEWSISSGNLNPNVTTAAVQWEIDWSDAKRKNYREAQPILSALEKVLGHKDYDLLDEVFKDLGVHDRQDVAEAHNLIFRSDLPEMQKKLFKDLYSLYDGQKDDQHGDDALDGYLIDVTDKNFDDKK